MNKEMFAAEIQRIIYLGLGSGNITVRQMFDVLCEHEETLRGIIYQRDNNATWTPKQIAQPKQWKSDPPASPFPPVTGWKSGL
jgi:hypothetical protein